jgi:DNA-binding response OmpR family regulator
VRGLDLAGRVRSERPDVQIILLTDDEHTVSLITRLRVERVRCILKPFDLELLRQAVGVSCRALRHADGDSSHEELARLERHQSRLERRLENLERSHSSVPPAPAPSEEPAPPAALAPAASPAPAGASDAATSRGAPALPRDVQVLVIDDDPLARRALARTLSKQHVILAENGVAATRELERSEPDVIVSDLDMPEMDGLAFAEEVKRRWPALADRIVFVSGATSQMDRAELKTATQPLVVKPVDGRELERRMLEVLERALVRSR